ncbi:MAG: GNAT family N-acetyltransferase [Anaerolineales bacterium]|nr:GNAT family N-acetyltransferase [Anaerolineales bacterium]
MEYRELPPTDIDRIGEINRAELITGQYIVEPDKTGLGLVARLQTIDPPLQSPAWSEAGTARRITDWRPHLDAGGWLYGAFDGDRFAGFIILGPAHADHSAEIVALFIDRDYRRQGIGQVLMNWAEGKARKEGIKAIFLYANPTLSSANFYRKMGYQITGLIAHHIVASLPGDITMAKRL